LRRDGKRAGFAGMAIRTFKPSGTEAARIAAAVAFYASSTGQSKA
jgi:hypothetical protein